MLLRINLKSETIEILIKFKPDAKIKIYLTRILKHVYLTFNICHRKFNKNKRMF